MLKLLKKVKFKTLFWFFFYLFIFSLLLRGSFNYLDPDLGWHLKVGQEIIETRAVPHINHYNYTYTGNWVDHEWLSNAGLYLLYSQAGYLVVSIVFALLIIFVLILLNVFAHKFWPDINPFPIILFQSLGVVASLPNFGIRIQELTLIFLLLLLLIIVYYNKNKNWHILLFLPPLMYLWSNMHASFLIGFFLMTAWLFIKIGENIGQTFKLRFFSDYSYILKTKEIIFFAIALMGSFLLTLVTPYRLELYSFLIKYQDSFYQSHLQEWLSQFSFPLQYWQLFYLALVFLAFILYIVYLKKIKKSFKISLWTIFLISLFLFLGFKSRRHIPLLFVVSFFFIIDIWKHIFSNEFSVKINYKYWRLNVWLKIFLLFCLFLASLSQIVQAKLTAKPFDNFCNNYPCGAVKFLKTNLQYDSLKLFNSYNYGGYLIWVYPERKLFIDGRLPQISFAEITFLEEYYKFFDKKEDIKKKLVQYNIGLVLLSATDHDLKLKNWEKVFFSIKNEELKDHNYLRDYLSSAGNWEKIYSDSSSVIYKRK